jgi:hypothetical protein
MVQDPSRGIRLTPARKTSGAKVRARAEETERVREEGHREFMSGARRISLVSGKKAQAHKELQLHDN